MIKIRPLVEDDLEFLIEVRNECRKKLHDCRKFTLDNAKKWFRQTKPKFYIIENDRKKVGYFRTSHWDLINNNVFIGCDIHKDYRRQGISTKAYKIFIDYFFKEYDFHKICLWVLSTNYEAIGLYKKLGFKNDGVSREHIMRDGRYIDNILMSILKREWYGKKIL